MMWFNKLRWKLYRRFHDNEPSTHECKVAFELHGHRMTKRINKVVWLASYGIDYAVISKRYGLSRERVRQMVMKGCRYLYMKPEITAEDMNALSKALEVGDKGEPLKFEHFNGFDYEE